MEDQRKDLRTPRKGGAHKSMAVDVDDDDDVDLVLDSSSSDVLVSRRSDSMASKSAKRTRADFSQADEERMLKEVRLHPPAKGQSPGGQTYWRRRKEADPKLFPERSLPVLAQHWKLMERDGKVGSTTIDEKTEGAEDLFSAEQLEELLRERQKLVQAERADTSATTRAAAETRAVAAQCHLQGLQKKADEVRQMDLTAVMTLLEQALEGGEAAKRVQSLADLFAKLHEAEVVSEAAQTALVQARRDQSASVARQQHLKDVHERIQHMTSQHGSEALTVLLHFDASKPK